jgi:hypothetical protein
VSAHRALVAAALARLAPAVPSFEREAILDHAMDSPGLRKGSPEAAAWLGLIATIRHLHTDYDRLLAEGTDPDAARWFVAAAIDTVLAEWGCRKRLPVDQG